ncbi:MAG: response regulator [Desulfobacteraceae bacterium]|nr:response regulator [Desulfobacteraceae bacterium]
MQSDRNRPERKRLEILIVEDSATQAERLDYTLTHRDFATLRAKNGREALEMLDEHRPDIVISDIMMPEMDGFTLCRRIKESEKTGGLPVILLTALSDPEDVLKGLESGADGFVTKPYDETYLLERVRRVLALPPAPPAEAAELDFNGRTYRIAAGRRRILDLLISTYETAVAKNRQLEAARRELETLNRRLEEKVRERTRSLEKEIEERKRAEAAVRTLNTELEDKVRERTGQLETANQKLRQSLAERQRADAERERLLADLARSNQELEQFAYIASHDLQTPLRAVSGFLDLLSRRYHGRLGREADEFIAYAVDGARRMHQLIEDILAYSRVGTRGTPFAPVDCGKALARALANLRPEIGESGGEIEKGELPTVSGDESQLVQLFQNLVGNALKYRKESEPPRIRVTAIPGPEEFLFAVEDNGIGLEPRFAERIFQIFQRLHTSGEYSGTGIGLAICKKIVERHGGRIWVESEPGQGATFRFTLPRR